MATTTEYDSEFAAQFAARGARTRAKLESAMARRRPEPRKVDAPGSFWHGAEVISEYTAEQAAEDGFLVDAREIGGAEDRRDEAGEIFRKQFKGRPVYLTRALYELIQKAVDHPRWGNDWAGVCWDIVWMARGAVRSAYNQAMGCGSGSGNFQVIITGCGRRRYQHLTATLDGNGLTFSLQGED